jgi:hypothetical protein
MHRAIDPSQIVRQIIDTAQETTCAVCAGALAISQHRDRYIWRMEGLVHHRARDKRCPSQECKGHGTLCRPLVDLRLALPRKSFGLDVILEVGRRHLEQEQSLSRIGRDLSKEGVPIHQTHVGELLRDYLAVCRLCRGDDPALQQKLREQGGIYLLVDGVQCDDKSPVLYMCWDGRSGDPLFGERLVKRDTDAVSKMLRRVKRMNVPVLGVTTDGETSLVQAVQRVFPEVPQQRCQTHFLFNCAEPLEEDLKELQASVEERAEKVRKLKKRLDRQAQASIPEFVSTPSVSPSPAAVPSVSPPPAAVPSVSLPPAVPSVSPPPAAVPSVSPPPAVPSVSPPPAAVPSVSSSPAAVPPASVPAVAQAATLAESAAQPSPLSELEMARTLCEAVRLHARVSGKAPLNPRQLVRHQRLEEVRAFLDEARKKKTPMVPASLRPGSISSIRR